ncbi:hypothetical protein AB0M57_04940 [Streptomyces sp. NPDC051597]|uniref:hypothetical protein n=1 Tax=Streptomyces sp. NPDC051597 TaxID=3155049 RepID=UPI003412259F
MSPTPSPDGSLRSAAVINEEIRRLVAEGRTGSEEYARLVAEYTAALRRGDVSPAA